MRDRHHRRLTSEPERDPAGRTASVRAARHSLLAAVAIAGATAGLVAIARGGQATWLCVPAALLAAARTRARLTGVAAAATVIAGALAAQLAEASTRGRPSSVLLVSVAALCVAVLLAMRGRLERERDALRASALTDPLTGAANRRSLLSRIDYEIARHARTGRSFALLMLDLDGFKELNDRFGHPAGDDLLREVAGALSGVIRDQDTVARVGGDEFCVLAPETDDAGAGRLISRVETAVTRVVAGVDALAASSGAAVFPRDGTSAGELVEAADQRLLVVKRNSRGARARRRAA
ncbi:MAG TPA: diguanylate cyclase [Solirubrobacteraceae bacterium]|nr:diguanylate cyclase [Solirubrobacteraceae bacterium]